MKRKENLNSDVNNSTNIISRLKSFNTKEDLTMTSCFSTNKTDRHDITEIFLNVALTTIKQTNKFDYMNK
jgi:hypothetical protein